MPKVIRAYIDFSQGHCFSPTPSLNGSTNVFINSYPVVRQGDSYGQSHSCGDSTHNMGLALEGSPNVFANGRAIHGDSHKISCGDVADNGSPNVFINETKGVVETIGYTVNLPRIEYPSYNVIVYTNCAKFYDKDTGVSYGSRLIADAYTPVVEENSGKVFKDYVIDLTNFDISPSLPPGLDFDFLTGTIKVAPNTFPTLATTFTITCKNYVGFNTPITQVTIRIDNPPPLFTCQ